MSDSFGDRMKVYEMAEAGRKLMPLLPIIARIDGRRFSKFTEGLDRPYDSKLSRLMIDTTKYLARETNARCGYTQSDEITLCWHATKYEGEVFFDGRISKMTSTLAAMASVYFNREMSKCLPHAQAVQMPTFDCRVWNVPNRAEGANVFLWRELDATKNSISMAARMYYEQAELHGKNGREMQEMLWRKGVNWNNYPVCFKRGTYIQRKVTRSRFTVEEMDNLPPKHEARQNPDLVVSRTEYVWADIPPLSQVANREDVIFRGEVPGVALEFRSKSH